MDREERKKSDPYRIAYSDGIERLVATRRVQADELRSEYITPDKVAADAERYRHDLCEILGWPLTEPRLGLPSVKTCEESEIEPGIIMRRIQIEALADVPFYGILLLPKKHAPAPLVISQHGGWGTPEQTLNLHSPNSYKDMSLKLARRGCAVFSPQLLLWQVEDEGERSGYHIEHNRAKRECELRQLGGGIAALELYELMRTLDYLETLPQIDSNRIGMIGISYGGFYTQMLAALDVRIKAASTNAFYNDRYTYCWHDFSWKASALRMKDAEICGLIAPRGLCVHCGKNDTVFEFDKALPEIERLKLYYNAQNALDKLNIILSDVNHTITDDDQEICFLLKNLA